jgi:hypothetical protein
MKLKMGFISNKHYVTDYEVILPEEAMVLTNGIKYIFELKEEKKN